MSRYLQHLPAFFAEDKTLRKLLLPFERILSGLQEEPEEWAKLPLGLEQLLDRIETYFSPVSAGSETPKLQAPASFLPWLADWVATSLRQDWDEETCRNALRDVVPLYRIRGTRAALQKMLEMYLKPIDPKLTVELFEDDTGTKFPPRYFQVRIAHVDLTDKSKLRRIELIAMEIIDREKPAHTWYGLKLDGEIVLPAASSLDAGSGLSRDFNPENEV